MSEQEYSRRVVLAASGAVLTGLAAGSVRSRSLARRYEGAPRPQRRPRSDARASSALTDRQRSDRAPARFRRNARHRRSASGASRTDPAEARECRSAPSRSVSISSIRPMRTGPGTSREIIADRAASVSGGLVIANEGRHHASVGRRVGPERSSRAPACGVRGRKRAASRAHRSLPAVTRSIPTVPLEESIRRNRAPAEGGQDPVCRRLELRRRRAGEAPSHRRGRLGAEPLQRC